MALKGQTDQETSGKERSEAKVLVIGQQENLQALSLVQASLFPVLAEGEGRHVSMFCQMLSTSASKKQPELQSFHLQLCRMPDRTAKNAGYALIGGRGLAPVAEDLGILADAGNSGAAAARLPQIALVGGVAGCEVPCFYMLAFSTGSPFSFPMSADVSRDGCSKSPVCGMAGGNSMCSSTCEGANVRQRLCHTHLFQARIFQARTLFEVQMAGWDGVLHGSRIWSSDLFASSVCPC